MLDPLMVWLLFGFIGGVTTSVVGHFVRARRISGGRRRTHAEKIHELKVLLKNDLQNLYPDIDEPVADLLAWILTDLYSSRDESSLKHRAQAIDLMREIGMLDRARKVVEETGSKRIAASQEEHDA